MFVHHAAQFEREGEERHPVANKRFNRVVDYLRSELMCETVESLLENETGVFAGR